MRNIVKNTKKAKCRRAGPPWGLPNEVWRLLLCVPLLSQPLRGCYWSSSNFLSKSERSVPPLSVGIGVGPSSYTRNLLLMWLYLLMLGGLFMLWILLARLLTGDCGTMPATHYLLVRNMGYLGEEGGCYHATIDNQMEAQS